MDHSAFSAFFEATYRPLWAFVFNGIGEGAVAEDLAQEAYFRLLQARTHHLEPRQLKAFLYRIATNLMHDQWRRSGHEGTERGFGVAVPEAATDGQGAARHDVRAAFEKLPAKQQTLLWLAYVEGYKHREIAGVLKVGERSVRVLLFRARRKFVGLLERMGIEGDQSR